VSVVSKLIPRIRLKLKDTEKTQYNDYMLLEAIRETDRLLRYTVNHFYKTLYFTIPDEVELQENSEIGWPTTYDDLIIEGTALMLSPGDYSTKEQVKKYWQSKVIELTGEEDASIPLVGYEEDEDDIIADAGEW
jgi:hypothetical protein